MSRRAVPETEVGEGAETDGGDLREVLGMSARRAPAMLGAGQVIDDAYRIEEELGAGGMGRVYRARDLRLGRDIALKLHAIALAPEDDSLRREATALARLTHPNVVTVYEVGTWSGHPWVAMEYVPGGNARSWLKAAPRSAREILALYIAAGRGLAAAHAAGLVHRDFKPDNVLVGDDGRPRVADFGLARELEMRAPEPAVDEAAPGVERTRTGFARGTPAYMAPEQRSGDPIDAAADQFAFAVAVWEALAGVRPFERTTAEAANEGPTTILPPPPGKLPRHVEAALRRALSTVPADRWPSMTALLVELERDPVRRRRRGLAFAAAGIAIATGGWAIARVSHGGAGAISCEPTTDELAAIWSPSRGAELRPGLGASADRVVAIVDGWTTRWRAQRRGACEATHVQHVQSPAMLDLRTACLDRARVGLAAALDVIATQHPKPTQALDAVTGLPRLEDCADLTTLAAGSPTPTTPGAIASGAGADALIARARALRMAGQVKPALAAARAAVAFADAIHAPAAGARGRIELASAIFGAGKLDGVLETFEDAARLAAEAKDDALTVRIWINVLDAIGVRLDKPGEAERLLVVAEAAVARIGKSPVYEGYLAGIRGDLAVQRQSFAAAVPLLEQRIRVHEQIYGKDDPDLARWLNRLATALSQVHRGAEAHAALDRAVTILESHYGPTHPNLGVLLTTRGLIEYQAGDYAAAVATTERALAIKEAALGPSHPSLLPTLMNLAVAHSDLGAKDKALTVARRGLAIAEAALPPTHPKLGFALTTLGQLLVVSTLWDEAATTLERAHKILEPLGDHAPLDETLRGLSAVRVHAKDLAGARQAADRAVAIAVAEYHDSVETARSYAQLGRVQLAAADVPGARTSLHHALDMVTTAVGAGHPEAVTLAAQLAALPADPASPRPR